MGGSLAALPRRAASRTWRRALLLKLERRGFIELGRTCVVWYATGSTPGGLCAVRLGAMDALTRLFSSNPFVPAFDTS